MVARYKVKEYVCTFSCINIYACAYVDMYVDAEEVCKYPVLPYTCTNLCECLIEVSAGPTIKFKKNLIN